MARKKQPKFTGTTIAMAVLSLIIVAETGFGVVYMKKSKDSMKKSQENIQSLQAQLSDYGDSKEVYFSDVEVPPGKPIDVKKLKKMKVPATMFSTSYITDPTVFNTTLAKVKIEAHSPILKGMLTPEVIYDGDRYYDVVADAFPVHLKVDDFIDYLITTPLGQKLAVFTKARVVALGTNSVTVKMSHEDIHNYMSALADHNMNPGTFLSASVYVEPGLQTQTIPYYAPSKTVLAAMQSDPNIKEAINQNLLNTRRAMIENNLKLDKDEQEAIIDGRSVMISKLLADMQTFRAEQKAKEEEGEKAEVTTEANSDGVVQEKSDDSSSGVKVGEK